MQAPSAAMCALAVALVLARLPGASATFGDTFSASLQNNTLPVGYKPVRARWRGALAARGEGGRVSATAGAGEHAASRASARTTGA